MHREREPRGREELCTVTHGEVWCGLNNERAGEGVGARRGQITQGLGQKRWDFQGHAKLWMLSQGAEVLVCEGKSQESGCPGRLCHSALGFRAGPHSRLEAQCFVADSRCSDPEPAGYPPSCRNIQTLEGKGQKGHLRSTVHMLQIHPHGPFYFL